MKASLPFLCMASLAAILSSAPPAAAAETGAVITLNDAFRFAPASVTIRAGEAAEWRNASHFPHIVTDDPKLGDAAIPAGAEIFSSGEIPPGGSFRRVLSVSGHYRYFCIPHEGIGMVGDITVLPR